MEFMTFSKIIKDIIDVIKSAVAGFEEKRDERYNFLLNEIVEPIHQSMCLVHGIYMSVFPEAERRIRSGDVSLQQLLQFLGERDLETHVVRDNLQGLISAARNRNDLPVCVISYLHACSNYFGHVTGAGVRSHLRALLHKLRKYDDIYTVPISEIALPENHYSAEMVSRDVSTAISCMPHELRQKWPSVVEKYHEARLILIEKTRLCFENIQLKGKQDETSNKDVS